MVAMVLVLVLLMVWHLVLSECLNIIDMNASLRIMVVMVVPLRTVHTLCILAHSIRHRLKMSIHSIPSIDSIQIPAIHSIRMFVVIENMSIRTR